MVLKPEPLFAAVEHLKKQAVEGSDNPEPLVVLMDPRGEPFTQTLAQELSQQDHIIFIAGRYEGRGRAR